MTTDEMHLQEARRLAEQTDELRRAAGREPLRAAVLWLTRRRYGRRRGWPVIPVLGSPWQDTVSAERPGWRMRAAFLAGSPVFEVDYVICRRCRLGWIEQPHTEEKYQRCGLASAGLAALRTEHPGLSWHTLGGHMAREFFATVGAEVPGGYAQRALCGHIKDW